MDKKFLFFDIDGTLVESCSNRIYESTHVALKKCQDAGHFVAIASGRPHFLTREIAAKLEIHNWVCDGGHGIVIDDTYVSYEPINQIVAFDLIKQCELLKLSCIFNTEDSGIARTIYCDEAFVVKTFYEHFSLQTINDLNNVHEVRRIVIDLDPVKIPLLRGLDLVDHMEYNGNFVIEPTSKYKGILKMTEMMNGNEKDIIVFGDGINDLEMFRKAPVKIAMGNAVHEIKELATFITNEVDQDGIYNACIKLKLIKN